MSVEALVAAELRRELDAVRPLSGAWRALRDQLADEAPVPLWHRVWDHGMSRRQFLRAAAAIAGAAMVPGLPAPPPSEHLAGSIIFMPPPPPGTIRAGIPTFSPAGPGPDTYLRGLGFCSDPYAVASADVATATADQLTLSVRRLASVADGTWLELEVVDAGVDAKDLPPPGHFDGTLVLRDPAGGDLAEIPLGAQRIVKHGWSHVTGWMRLHVPGVRLHAGEVVILATVTARATTLVARVRLLPVAEVGQPASRPRRAQATVRGITIRVVAAALGGDPAVLRLDASEVGGAACIGSRMGTRGRGGELVLRDAQGREYLEEIALHPTSHGSTLFDDVAHFPRLPADARGLELIVPTLSFHDREGEAVVEVPIRGLRVGVRQPLPRDLRLGGYSLRITEVELLAPPALALHLDLGHATDGRLLLYPAQVVVDGRQLGWNMRWRPGNVMRADVIEVPLPPGHGDVVGVTMRTPAVEVEGPWVVPLDLPVG